MTNQQNLRSALDTGVHLRRGGVAVDVDLLSAREVPRVARYSLSKSRWAEIGLGEIAPGKFDFDVAGHYARPDVFRLIVDEEPKPLVWPA
jgi:hypothetical protein